VFHISQPYFFSNSRPKDCLLPTTDFRPIRKTYFTETGKRLIVIRVGNDLLQADAPEDHLLGY